MRWSVTLQAVGDRVLTREEVVELADAVAPHAGVASGIGTNAYGASLVVEAETHDAAVDLATGYFVQAAATAGLPRWPVSHSEALNEDGEA
jgi:nitrite reductase/ring-hydroxylating ferredoxin subunit